MIEAITDAVEELKRVDHLIYVSLKYTRTVDVIRSVINRIIECYDAIIDGFVKKLEEENKIMEIPNAPMQKVNLILQYFKEDKELAEYFRFYIFLRQLYRADYTRSTEYRKHVKMTSDVQGKKVEVEIDTVVEYYEKTKKFLHYIKDNYVHDDEE